MVFILLCLGLEEMLVVPLQLQPFIHDKGKFLIAALEIESLNEWTMGFYVF